MPRRRSTRACARGRETIASLSRSRGWSFAARADLVEPSQSSHGFRGASAYIPFDDLVVIWHTLAVVLEVDGTAGFAGWFAGLSDDEQVSVGRIVDLLVEHGPSLPFPYSSGVESSRHRHMRELRAQHQGRPYRVLYAFDPRRARFFYWVATRPEPTAGTKRTCRRPTPSTMSIFGNSNGKG
jgi:hypothetical protein